MIKGTLSPQAKSILIGAYYVLSVVASVITIASIF